MDQDTSLYFTSQLSEHPGETEKKPLLADDSSDEDEENPLVNLKIRRRHPFVKMLLALWPFGESFKELGILGKIYEIFKVSGYYDYSVFSSNPCILQ